MSTVPQDLHSLEYSRHLLEEILGWPAKGNLELMADCLTAIQVSRKLPTAYHAHKYMLRAIKLAKEQCIEINRFWFQNGEYTNIRPPKPLRQYEPVDAERTKMEQSTPEWEESAIRARMALAKLAGKVFEPACHSKEKLKQQAEEIRQRRSSDAVAEKTANE